MTQLVGVLAHVKAEKDAVEILVQPVEAADKLLFDMHNLQEQVEDLEYKLDARGQGVKTMEEIQNQLNALQMKRCLQALFRFDVNLSYICF